LSAGEENLDSPLWQYFPRSIFGIPNQQFLEGQDHGKLLKNATILKMLRLYVWMICPKIRKIYVGRP
jgi:hypothetical protein